jgi:hypothetical protein
MRTSIMLSMVLVLLCGCSSLNPLESLNPFKEDKGLEVSAQVGKTNTQIKKKQLAEISVDSKIDSKNVAETITQQYNTTEPWIIYSLISMVILFFLIVPSPFVSHANKKQIRILEGVIEHERKKQHRVGTPPKAP